MEKSQKALEDGFSRGGINMNENRSDFFIDVIGSDLCVCECDCECVCDCDYCLCCECDGD